MECENCGFPLGRDGVCAKCGMKFQLPAARLPGNRVNERETLPMYVTAVPRYPDTRMAQALKKAGFTK